MILSYRDISDDPEAKLSGINLRTEVLRKPLGLSFSEEDIKAEKNQIQLAAFNGDVLIGILLLVIMQNNEIKMRQVAVDPVYRSIGVGRGLVIYSETYVQKFNCSKMILNARISARDFYLSLGYETDDVMFKEVGIDHIKMWKRMKSL